MKITFEKPTMEYETVDGAEWLPGMVIVNEGDVAGVRTAIERLERMGHDGIKVTQLKRYLNADAISVGGKWYPVRLDFGAAVNMCVSYDVPRTACEWIDENGRAISEVSYGER